MMKKLFKQAVFGVALLCAATRSLSPPSRNPARR